MKVKHVHEVGTNINEEGFGCIYCITNIINGMQYVGQTHKEYVSARWAEHKYLAKIGATNVLLYEAFRKFGIENFEFSILQENVPIENLFEREIFYIAQLNTFQPNGYNMTKGGGGTVGLVSWNKGLPCPDDVKEKISAAYTEERKEKAHIRMSGKNNPMYGKTGELSPVYGSDRSGEKNGFYGKNHTDEVKVHLSILKSSVKKKIEMLDKDTEEVLMVHESIAAAAKYLKCCGFPKADDGAISKCAKGRYKTVYGYKWKFVEVE